MSPSFTAPELPPQPPEADWPFEAELSRPLHPPRVLDGPPPAARELDLREGLRLDHGFPDPDGRLATAVADFGTFRCSVGLRADTGPELALRPAPGLPPEAWRLAVRRAGMTLAAADTEGIRRGLVALEDALLARNAPCLPLGVTRRDPVIRTRLSRCFHGPINRPPKCRDELLDDTDYYPDGYLNRLAHHGINGLWLTIRFRDLLASAVLPELRPDAAAPRRLAKLRRVVRQCARYGIRIYPFCIEPAALPADDPVLAAHPDLRGAPVFGDRALFCTSSATGKAYLEDALRRLFTEVPGLGGLLCIPVGERFTHCVSGRLPTACPRCALRDPGEVLADTLAAMERGMRAAAPDAELIAWPYGQLVVWGPDATRAAAGKQPPGVILQHNFETGGKVRQLGRWRPLWDYWLSWPGPSPVFADCARAVRRNGGRMFAKLQTSCSHEVATTQFVPVPGLLYRKYRRMHALGVSGVVQGWYFGNYPSVMTRASQRLAFAPLPATETAFLRELAASRWGRHAPAVVRAWRHFADGYAQYPGSQRFGYYGPMHDGIVWPLFLQPRHLPLAPTWRNVHPLSGDQAGECIAPEFTYAEVLTLCRGLRDDWRKGLAALRRAARDPSLDADCRREFQAAQALGLQFESAHAILLFYALRDRLAFARGRGTRAALLARLRRIVLEEIDRSTALLALCRENRTLGFHSEAEGYKYFPAALRDRLRQLNALLRTEFPRVARQLEATPLPGFEAYTGLGGSVRACACPPGAAHLAARPFAPEWSMIPPVACRAWAAPRASEAARPFPFQSTLFPLPSREAPRGPGLAWRAAWTPEAIVFCLSWPNQPGPDRAPSVSPGDELRVTLEPDRLGSGRLFTIPMNAPGPAVCGALRLATHRATDGRESRLAFAVPFRRLGLSHPADGRRPAPLRVQVACFLSPIADPLCFSGKPLLNSWAPMRRTLPRNLLGYSDPSAYGWLRFRKVKSQK